MWVGIVACAVAVAIASAVALYRRRVDGRFAPAEPTAAARPDSDDPTADPDLTEDDLGTPLGAEATVVQFSSSFCAPCRAAERVITDALSGLDGVRHVDVDAEQRLDLVRRFNVLRTPTVLIADADGRVVARTAGVPTRQSLSAALPVRTRG